VCAPYYAPSEQQKIYQCPFWLRNLLISHSLLLSFYHVVSPPATSLSFHYLPRLTRRMRHTHATHRHQSSQGRFKAHQSRLCLRAQPCANLPTPPGPYSEIVHWLGPLPASWSNAQSRPPSTSNACPASSHKRLLEAVVTLEGCCPGVRQQVC